MKIKILIVTAILAGLFVASCKKDNSAGSAAIAITGVTLDKTKDTIRTTGATTVLFATRTPADATNKDVIWSSSNPKIADVGAAGLVTYYAVGDVVITVTTVDGGYSASCNVNCAPFTTTATYSVHTNQTPGAGDTDGPYEMGMSFKTSKDGKIQKIRFYKSPADVGVHTGIIWTADGSSKLATVVFTGETASGWQNATLSTPLSIVKNIVYVVSVNSVGGYVATNSAFDSAITNGPITGIKGFYGSGGPGTFPTESYQNGDYYRDVVFNPTEQ